MKNQIMLITYADSMGENLSELRRLLRRYFLHEIKNIHLLPFYPSSGDRGFAPINYRQVEPTFGTWEDVALLAEDFDLTFDFMINHLSRQSEQFQDFIAKHEDSVYKEMFLRFATFWPGGEPTEAQIEQLNRRKPGAPFTLVRFQDQSEEKLWCTFDSEQIDLDLRSEITWKYIEDTLNFLIKAKAAQIRLDAFAFATKKVDTSCFFLEPEVWELLERVKRQLDQAGVALLPEIHDHYSIQLKIADKGFWVYDFVLPVMVLHTLYSKDSRRLAHWLSICPRKQQTTLDTHDGMGVIDAADLLSEEELEAVVNQTEAYGANFKWHYAGDTKGRQVVYQINCTYYSALGEDDNRYLLARAIQFFTPGIPQVYYVGLLAGANDYELMEKTQYPRNISRHNYTEAEVVEAVKRPVVKQLCHLMQFRNQYPAFNGELCLLETEPSKLSLCWEKEDYCTVLEVDLKEEYFQIKYKDKDANWQQFDLHRDFEFSIS